MSDRGFIHWSPRRESLERIDMVRAILLEYEAHLPLTLRQIFYRAVGQYGYDKTEAAYKRLGRTLAKARRAELIDMGAIRDDGISNERASGYQSLSNFEDVIKRAGKSYHRHPAIGQRQEVMVICEAAGMVPQLSRVAHPYGVDVRSSGGFDSVTAKHDLAQDISQSVLPVVVLHIGDLDPSGESMFDVISEDVGAFVRDYAKSEVTNSSVEFVRIAVTREQAVLYDLPTAPKKETDSRAKNFEGNTVQCEALPPNTLNRIVQEAIEARIDMDVFRDNQLAEIAERERIAEVLSRLTFEERA